MYNLIQEGCLPIIWASSGNLEIYIPSFFGRFNLNFIVDSDLSVIWREGLSACLTLAWSGGVLFTAIIHCLEGIMVLMLNQKICSSFFVHFESLEVIPWDHSAVENAFTHTYTLPCTQLGHTCIHDPWGDRADGWKQTHCHIAKLVHLKSNCQTWNFARKFSFLTFLNC